MAQPVVPEPKFFLVDELYDKGIEYYSKTWIAAAPPGKIVGEKTTNYLESPAAALRIRKHLPDVKLVFIFRNPIDRAYSNYLWTKMNGLETESFERALELEESRTKTLPTHLKYARPYSYGSRGFYCRMLEIYLDLFPRQNILCLRTEDVYLPESRARLIARLHDFIGVESRAADGAFRDVVNASRDPSDEPMSPNVREYLNDLYREEIASFAELAGGEFESWQEDQNVLLRGTDYV